LNEATRLELLAPLLEFVLHPDQALAVLMTEYGTWVYAILFVVLFCETGLVVTPFLPGDSLLFIAGALWASAGLDVVALMAVLISGALVGDNCNYWIGRVVGVQLLHHAKGRWINARALERTEMFYRRHGGKTIVIARFVPIVRTFAPFVAGLGRMPYARFLLFSIGGALLWVCLLVPLGYWFGNVSWVRANFGLVTIAIIAASVTPLVVEFAKHLRRPSKGA
jgi:membrane-associated protein